MTKKICKERRLSRTSLTMLCFVYRRKFNGWLKWNSGNLISGSLTKTKADSFGESYVLRRITYELSEKATNKPCEKDLCFRHTEVDRIFFRSPHAILYFLFLFLNCLSYICQKPWGYDKARGLVFYSCYFYFYFKFVYFFWKQQKIKTKNDRLADDALWFEHSQNNKAPHNSLGRSL